MSAKAITMVRAMQGMGQCKYQYETHIITHINTHTYVHTHTHIYTHALDELAVGIENVDELVGVELLRRGKEHDLKVLGHAM